MDEIREIYNFAAPHWPGLALAIVGMLMVQVEKNSIFSLRMAHQGRKGQNFFWWGRKTLPMHPVILGIIVGIFWQNPQGAEPPWPWIGSLMYFAAFGAGSPALFQIAKGLLKSKANIDLGALPGQDPPNALPEAESEPEPEPEPDKEADTESEKGDTDGVS